MSRGLTLAELLVSISIMLMVMVAVYAFQVNVFTYSSQSQNQINTIWQAESLLKTMARELRTIVPSGNGSYPIASVSSTSITFFANVDADSSIEQVTYTLSTTTSTLFRGVVQPSGSPIVYTSAPATTTLANGVKASSTLPLFQYFDGYFAGTSSPLALPLNISNVRLVKININIDIDPNRSPLPRTFSTAISFRNLKTNL